MRSNRFLLAGAFACALAPFAVAQPASFTDLGTHNSADETVTQLVTLSSASNIQWFKIVLPAASNGAGSYVDMWNNTPGDMTDDEMGIYNNTGGLVANDDDSGPGSLAQLSFGQTSPTRPAIGTGNTFNGTNGALTAGTYWIAVGRFNVTFNATNWSVTSNYTGSQRTITLSIHVHPAGLPTNPTGTGTATPAAGGIGTTFVAKVTVTPGTSPTSTGLAVSLDASLVNGGTVTLLDDGVAPDVTAGDNIFSGNVTVGAGTTVGNKSLPFSITDAQSRNGSGTLTFSVTPPNDNCANATPIGEGTLAWDNSAATTDGASPSCQSSSSKDIWFQYVPTFTGLQTISLCGTNFDTVLSVYSSCGGSQLACDDDTCDGVNPPGSGLASIITNLSVTNGTPVLIRVAAFGSSASGGPGTLTIPPPPSNPTGAGTATPSNGVVGATFVAAVQVSPGNNPTSTGLAVSLDASNVNGGTVVLHDDGVAPDATAGDNIFSGNVTVGPSATLGLKSLPFSITDAQARSGSGSLSFTVTNPPPANDLCANAIPVTNGSYSFDNTYASNEGSAACQASSGFDIWYVYTPTISGNADIATCGSNQDTVLSIHSTCGGASIACDDDSCDGVTPPGSSLASKITAFPVTAGTSYYIRVATYTGFGGTGGPGVLTINGPTTNPTMSGGVAIPDHGGIGQTFICRATVVPGVDPNSTGIQVHLDGSAVNDSASIVMRDNGVPPDQTAGDHIYACTVTVGAGTTLGAKTLVASMTDLQGRQASTNISFSVVPANDDCGNATPIGEGTLSWSNVGATDDGSASCQSDSGADIWYQYVPTQTGNARISLCGTNFDTVLSVQDSCGINPTTLACDDDTCDGVNPPGSGLASVISSVAVTAGTPVYVRIAGYSGFGDPDTGSGTLTIDFPNTPPTGTGTATPSSGHNGDSFVAAVTVTPGGNPVSSGISVSLDASNVDGGTVGLHDDGIAPDVTAGDNIFSGTVTVGPGATPGLKSLPFSILDAQSRTGSGNISYTVLAPPPPNDNCGNATTVIEGSYSFDNSSASTDGASPSCQATTNKDIWYDYIASHGGTVEITTCGTNFDTVLSVTDTCGGVEEACDDDSCDGVSPPGSTFASDITGMPVTRNTHYLIRLAAYGSSPAGGAGTLAIILTPGPCPGDLNGDLVIDLSDLAQFLGAYGATSVDPNYIPGADLNHDGVIDLSDLAQFLGLYGVQC